MPVPLPLHVKCRTNWCVSFPIQLAKESGITIAKMDATANDVAKPYEVSG